ARPRPLRAGRPRNASSGACRGSARRSNRTSPASAIAGPVAETALPETAEPILRLRGIGRRFGGLHAVRDVDLDVAHGERRAILGPNGAGKTTLFNVISGDVAPIVGTIVFLGDVVSMILPRSRAKLGVWRSYQ